MAAWGYEFYLLVLKVSPSGHVISSISDIDDHVILFAQKVHLCPEMHAIAKMAKNY